MKTILIAGAAGAGLNSSQIFIEKGLRALQFNLMSYRNYMSRVRGGLNYTFISYDRHLPNHVASLADFAILLDASDYDSIRPYLAHDAVIIAHEAVITTLEHTLYILGPDSIKPISTHKNAFGIAAIGLLFNLIGSPDHIFALFKNKKWPAKSNAENEKLLQLGYNHRPVTVQLSYAPQNDTMLINGNQATALGALAAGVGFYCAYPMAPSTGIMNYMGTHERESQVIVEQAEDEISAVIATIGASACGVRAMTGTSGGGFSLMVEAIGYAAVSETPLVIANVMRPGPATGLPTRTEQADLLFAVTASQGEFTRIILAPRTIEDCFYTTFRAFNLADQYQVPVIILTDQLLADSTQTLAPFTTTDLKIDQYLDLTSNEAFKRYDFNATIANRKYPGLDATLIMTDSHIHDESGHISEKESDTIALKHKFLRREKAIAAESLPPLLEGAHDPKVVFVCWGSTYGAAYDAMVALNAENHAFALLSFTHVFPLNASAIQKQIPEDALLISVELNATHQFAKLLCMETGISIKHHISKYDGRPFTATEITRQYKELINE